MIVNKAIVKVLLVASLYSLRAQDSLCLCWAMRLCDSQVREGCLDYQLGSWVGCYTLKSRGAPSPTTHRLVVSFKSLCSPEPCQGWERIEAPLGEPTLPPALVTRGLSECHCWALHRLRKRTISFVLVCLKLVIINTAASKPLGFQMCAIMPGNTFVWN